MGDPGAFRLAMRQLVSGVTVVATDVDGVPSAMTATSVTSVSLEPPTVLVCLDHGSRTCAAVRARGRFSVSILSARQTATALRLGRRGHLREYGDEFERTGDGLPVVRGAIAQLICTMSEALLGTTHAIVLGSVDRVTTCEGDALGLLHGRLLPVSSARLAHRNDHDGGLT